MQLTAKMLAKDILKKTGALASHMGSLINVCFVHLCYYNRLKNNNNFKKNCMDIISGMFQSELLNLFNA